MEFTRAQAARLTSRSARSRAGRPPAAISALTPAPDPRAAGSAAI